MVMVRSDRFKIDRWPGREGGAAVPVRVTTRRAGPADGVRPSRLSCVKGRGLQTARGRRGGSAAPHAPGMPAAEADRPGVCGAGSHRPGSRLSRGFRGLNHLETIRAGGTVTPFSLQNFTAPGWRGIPIFTSDSNLGAAVCQ